MQTERDPERKPHILIVEEEILISWALEDGLQRAGYRTTVVESGKRAILLLSSINVDVVIADFENSNGDSFAVVAVAKSLSPPVPVIGIGEIDKRLVINSDPRIMIDCPIEKPFQIEEVIRSVNKLTAAPLYPTLSTI